MLDFTNCNRVDVIVHQVRNQTTNDELILSYSLLNTEELRLRELLIKYFLYPFNDIQEYYAFTFSHGEFTINPLYRYSSNIFSNEISFKKISESIAKHLYEIALQPQIKSGDLFIATFENINVDGELVNALGIFKSESRQQFLQLYKKSKEFSLKF